jgi:hypothetical protein
MYLLGSTRARDAARFDEVAPIGMAQRLFHHLLNEQDCQTLSAQLCGNLQDSLDNERR